MSEPEKVWSKEDVANLVKGLTAVKHGALNIEKNIGRDKHGNKLITLWSLDSEDKLNGLVYTMETMEGDDAGEWLLGQVERTAYESLRMDRNTPEGQELWKVYNHVNDACKILQISGLYVNRAHSAGIYRAMQEKHGA